jgi:hypothetical protein
MRLILPLLLLASPACSRVAPAVSATPSPFAGRYACAGQEFGLPTAAGDLTLSPNGVATFRDYYAHEQSGTWALGGQANTLRFQGMDLLTATYDLANKLLGVLLKPASQITHTPNHFMECTRASPPGTAPP